MDPLGRLPAEEPRKELVVSLFLAGLQLRKHQLSIHREWGAGGRSVSRIQGSLPALRFKEIGLRSS